jgi:hypothetical protein
VNAVHSLSQTHWADLSFPFSTSSLRQRARSAASPVCGGLGGGQSSFFSFEGVIGDLGMLLGMLLGDFGGAPLPSMLPEE